MVRFSLSVGVLLATAVAALGQRHTPASPHPSAQLKAQHPHGGKPGAGKPLPLPDTPVQKLLSMPPGERQRFLEQLPPERRARIEDRLRQFNALPPEQQQRLTERFQMFRNLPPAQQEEYRNVFRRFREQPEQRRPALRREIQQLQSMNQQGRAARLESDEFRNRFSPEEQDIVRRMAELGPRPE